MAGRVGQKLGNYRITGVLGRGGFAEVYLGEHVYLKTQAAVKVLHTRLSIQDDTESFVKEAQTIAQLSHPHIIRVLDFGVDDETPYLVMDYATNGTLRQRHPRGSQLTLGTIVPYVKQIADALQYAHDERFIHRDVKPENMLVSKRGDILLSDFGIALAAQSSRNQSTQDVTGTVAYMAPEQIQGKPRPASDQYSLGITVYEWLTGSPPFKGSFTELCVQHMYADVPPLHERLATISHDVELVVMTALAKDAKQRFGSITAFANALEQAAGMKQATGPIVRPSSPLQGTPPSIEQKPRPTPLPSVSPTNAPPVRSESISLPQSEPAQPVRSESLPQSEPIRMANTSTPPTQFSTTSNSGGISTGPAQPPKPIVSEPHQPAREAQPLVRPISIWKLNRSRVIATLIGGVLYAIATYAIDHWAFSSSTLFNPIANVAYLPSVGNLFFGLILIVPFFFGAVFGPWAGMIIALAGGLAGDALASALVGWYWYAGSTLPGLFAGIALGRSQRKYWLRSSRMTALRWCLSACILLALWLTLGSIVIDHASSSGFFQILSSEVLFTLTGIIPLPFALSLFARSRRNG